MGDRLATIDMGRKEGVVPLWGELGPHLTQCCLGRGTSLPSGILIHPAVWPQQVWTQKLGGCAPILGGGVGPHLTQFGQG